MDTPASTPPGDTRGPVAADPAPAVPDRAPVPSHPAAMDRLPLWLAAFALALYAPSVLNGWTNWDDTRLVRDNPFVREGLAGIVPAFLRGYDGAYTPLTHAVACAVRAAVGDRAWAFHAVQVVVSAAGVALVPRALAAFGVGRTASAVAAVLWAAHPVQVETVAWASGLKDALAGAGVLSALALRGEGRRAASLLAFVAALLSKATVFPVAGLFVLIEARSRPDARTVLRRSAPYLLASLLAGWIAAGQHFGAPEATLRAWPGGGPLGAVPAVVALPWWYLARVAVPRHPQAIYEFQPVGWLDPRGLSALILWGGLVAWILSRPPKDRAAWWAGVAGFALPLLAVTGLAPMVFAVADRYAHLPSLAVLAGLAVAGVAAVRARPGLVGAARVGLACAVVGLAASSVARQREWRDGVALWEADLRRAPSVLAVRVNLAGAYGGASRWDDAIRTLKDARELAPDEARLTRDLFFAAAAKGRMSLPRIQAHLEALAEAGRRPNALLGVAASALREGQPAAARMVVEAALRAGGGPAAHALLARVEAAEGRHEQALAEARAALAAQPAREGPRVDAALALVRLGRLDEAIAETERPLADRAAGARLRSVRAYALYRAGRTDEARAVLAEVRADLPATPELEALVEQLDGKGAGDDPGESP